MHDGRAVYFSFRPSVISEQVDAPQHSTKFIRKTSRNMKGMVYKLRNTNIYIYINTHTHTKQFLIVYNFQELYASLYRVTTNINFLNIRLIQTFKVIFLKLMAKST